MGTKKRHDYSRARKSECYKPWKKLNPTNKHIFNGFTTSYADMEIIIKPTFHSVYSFKSVKSFKTLRELNTLVCIETITYHTSNVAIKLILQQNLKHDKFCEKAALF